MSACVPSVTCCRRRAPDAWIDGPGRRGDEFGLFEFGSTIVLLLAADAGQIDALEPGTRLRMGDPIGRLASALTLPPEGAGQSLPGREPNRPGSALS